MKIVPLNEKIVVERLEADERTAGGIILPDTAKEKPKQGKIISVGDGKLLDDGKRAADLWPLAGNWLKSQNLDVYTWEPSLFGYRYALIAAVIGGARVLYNSLESLFEGRIGADLAIAIACLAAIVLKEELVAAEVVFIGLAGECLEAYTFGRTRRALGSLAELFPQRCWVLRDGQEVRT